MRRLRIVQRIVDRRWAYLVQARRWFLWRDVAGPYVMHGEAVEAFLAHRVDTLHGGDAPWRREVIKA